MATPRTVAFYTLGGLIFMLSIPVLLQTLPIENAEKRLEQPENNHPTLISWW